MMPKIVSKSHGRHTVLTYSRQHMHNKKKIRPQESTGTVLAKDPLKVKLENLLYTSKVPELG